MDAHPTAAPHSLEAAPPSCRLSLFPLEVWLHVLHAADDFPTAESFSRVCRHGRAAGLRFLIPSFRDTSSRLFSLDVHVGLQRQSGRATAFDFTSRVTVLSRIVDMQPIPRVIARTFPRLSALSLIFRPVDRHYEDRIWQDFHTALTDLHELSPLPRLRHLAIFAFAAHGFGVDMLDLHTLHILEHFGDLECLDLRISGGLDITALADIPLPRNLRQLRVSADLFYFLATQRWTTLAHSLRGIVVEDMRNRQHLRRASDGDAAQTLGGSLWAAAPAWSSYLVSLRLLGVRLNLAGVLALGQLTALGRLDFHPSVLLLSPVETQLLQRETHPRHPDDRTYNADKMDVLWPLAGKVLMSDWNDILALADPLRYLLSRLSQLRVVHFGRGDWPSASPSPQHIQDTHTILHRKFQSYVPRSLSLWQFGVRDLNRNSIYVHLPTCGLCQHLPSATRTAACLRQEREWDDVPYDDWPHDSEPAIRAECNVLGIPRH